MRNFEDLTGKIFNNIKVLNSVKFDKNNRKCWLCLCLKCNNKRILVSRDVKRFKTCGCNIGGNAYKLNKGEASFNRMFNHYQRGAKKRGLEFSISKNKFKQLTKENCYYCGIEPRQIYKSRSKRKKDNDYIYNGIDRINNDLGYTEENSVACCTLCNFMKRTMNANEFIKQAKNIADFQNGK